MRRSRLLLVAAASVLLAACTYKPGYFNEYKIDIQQGNVLTQDMVAQLKPGQTRDQVRFLLGTPLVMDIFHAQRWDYIYRYQTGRSGAVDTRRLAVFFDADGRLQRVDGDITAGEASDTLPSSAKSRLVDFGTLPEEEANKPLPPPEKPGFFRRFLNYFGI